MLNYENQIAKMLKKPGTTVFYLAKPNYDGSNPIPVSVTLNAYKVSAAGEDEILGVPISNNAP
jgi:hypothetical protein